jgi:hypothetical protein
MAPSEAAAPGVLASAKAATQLFGLGANGLQHFVEPGLVQHVGGAVLVHVGGLIEKGGEAVVHVDVAEAVGQPALAGHLVPVLAVMPRARA